jgi:hypothetical protein
MTRPQALPKVRRTLANVPTYMIMDDHDATDDWNLNPIWVDRVNNTTFGRAILRNALASYTLFQDWGNDPVRYLSEDTAAARRSEAHARRDRQMFRRAERREAGDRRRAGEA